MGGKISSFGKALWGGIKKVGSKVMPVFNGIRSGISKGFDFVKKIPVIGDIADKAASTPIPQLKGLSLKDIGSKASGVLDTANKINDHIQGSGSGSRPRPSRFIGSRKRPDALPDLPVGVAVPRQKASVGFQPSEPLYKLTGGFNTAQQPTAIMAQSGRRGR